MPFGVPPQQFDCKSNNVCLSAKKFSGTGFPCLLIPALTKCIHASLTTHSLFVLMSFAA